MGNNRIEGSEELWRDMVTKEITRLKEALAWTRAQKDAQNIELGRALSRGDDCEKRLGNVREHLVDLKERYDTARGQVKSLRGRLTAKQEKMDADQERYLTDMQRGQLQVKILRRKIEAGQPNVTMSDPWILQKQINGLKEIRDDQAKTILALREERNKLIEQRMESGNDFSQLLSERDSLSERLNCVHQENDALNVRIGQQAERMAAMRGKSVQIFDRALDRVKVKKIAAEQLNRGLTIELERVTRERNECQRRRGGRIVKEMDLEKQINHLVNMLDNAGPVVDLANEACDQARAERDEARGNAMATHEQVERLAGKLAAMRTCQRGLLDDYHKMRRQRNKLRKDYQRMMRKNDG